MAYRKRRRNGGSTSKRGTARKRYSASRSTRSGSARTVRIVIEQAQPAAAIDPDTGRMMAKVPPPAKARF